MTRDHLYCFLNPTKEKKRKRKKRDIEDRVPPRSMTVWKEIN